MVPKADVVLAELLATDASAREEWNRDFKLKNDVRVTSLGRFLRKTSLDELPQLWNVLRGDMSLVGPRPIVKKELERYGPDAYYYLSVRPGVTGLWQVSGRNNVDYATRVALDVSYVKRRSTLLDISILLRTFKVVFDGSGAY
ncbi:sugar transferase [Paraburkholderia sp. BL18I3N2]|nr:sugar transferase [Paraburkholderia sp. BL18I3N2]